MKEGGQAIGKQCRKIRLAEQQGRFSLKCTTFHCHDTNSPFDGHSLLSQATHDTRRAKRRKGVRAPGKERRNGVMTKGLLSLWNAHGYWWLWLVREQKPEWKPWGWGEGMWVVEVGRWGLKAKHSRAFFPKVLPKYVNMYLCRGGREVSHGQIFGKY